jgi:metallo-beta-lactamase family protein
MKIQFLGAARMVTGSKHLLTLANNKKVLLDCGLVQQKGSENDSHNRHLGFDPLSLDTVILSHAHIDHSGNLPNLVKQGFNGPIYCTPATKDLLEVMLADSARIQEADIAYLNRKRNQQGRELLKPLYEMTDVIKCLSLMIVIPYGQTVSLFDHTFSFRFHDAGHILGSAFVYMEVIEEKKSFSLVFTGDVGRKTDLLLKDPEPLPPCDFLICESTYGNRLHESNDNASLRLLEIVRHTCIHHKGKLLIPAFSLGRTQEIVYCLDRLQDQGLLPSVPVYVDSPLSTNATEILRRHPEALNDEVREYMKHNEDPFGFNQLQYIRQHEDSLRLNSLHGPAIIISASGMMEAGRIKHHLKHHIGDESCTLLIVGYCPPGTLGRRLMEGEKQVNIFGKTHQVRISVEVINTFSAHADYAELGEWLDPLDRKKLQKIFLVHGEPESQTAFSAYLRKRDFKDVVMPEDAETFEI